MPQLVVLTGPIAAGKNTVADKLAERLTDRGKTVVVADVDDVAGMVATPGAAEVGLWFAAHKAHGALVGQWMRSSVEYVVVVGVEFGASWRRSVIARCRRQGRPRLASLAFRDTEASRHESDEEQESAARRRMR